MEYNSAQKSGDTSLILPSHEPKQYVIPNEVRDLSGFIMNALQNVAISNPFIQQDPK